MKLCNDPNWKAIHLGDRTILQTDKSLYDSEAWSILTTKILVDPCKEKGHYRMIIFDVKKEETE